ncbi:hypothetical protein B6U99_06690, partial [Candidatus Geothermarchaeota archaeon ex4572_27]
MRFYEFRSLNMPVLTSTTAQEILRAREAGASCLPLTFNLGLSKTMAELRGDGAIIEGHFVPYEDLRWALKDEDAVYIVEPPGRLRKAVLFAEGKFYKLK